MHAAFLEKDQLTLKSELEEAIIELEKVQESLSFERKELENVKAAIEKWGAEICQLEAAITNEEHGYRSGGQEALTRLKASWSGEFGKSSVGLAQEVRIWTPDAHKTEWGD